MITINEFMDIRMQQHIAHEIYRHQIMQRIPDPFPPILPFPIPRHIVLPPRANLPAAEAKLQNDELWKQFHEVGTEMIITKSGRRMFPSMRLSISGLDDESNYCVVLEMVPIGDCRYKFSGSQWIPAGGAEPQSTQRMYLHADSPASGAHWQAQPILFNKVKLTNNTLDSSGHIVLTSMHKYQPRIHIIRTSDPTQIPWSPQKAFFFSETEFVAVTAYQNDRITKLKIDNNPFAKGFRETGQSRCKRKMCSPEIQVNQTLANSLSVPNNGTENQQNELSSEHSCAKRMRSNGSSCSVLSIDEVGFSLSISSNNSSGRNSPSSTDIEPNPSNLIASNRAIVHNMEPLISPAFINCPYFERQQQMSDHPSLYLNLHELPIKCLESTEIPTNESTDCNTKTVVNNIINPEIVDGSKTLRSNKFSISAILGSNS